MVGFVGGENPAPPLEHSMKIFVFEPREIFGTSAISIMVDGSDAVEVLKLYVLEIMGVPLGRQRLIYRRQKLQNGRTMRSYGITQGSTVRLEIMSRGADGFPVPHLKDGQIMEVYIKDLTGRTITVVVKHSCTGGGLLFKLMEKGVIPAEYIGAYRLIFAGKQLERSKTLASYDIHKESTLYLVCRIWGGGPGHFVDLENKDAMQTIGFTDVGEPCRLWSAVRSGLNIEGKCTQPSCAAHDRRVIHQMGYGVFNVTTDDDVRCPSCMDTIKAISCGFTDCQWMYRGRKKGSDATVISEWHVANDDQYERFREAGNTIDWDFLVIEALETSPRPQCPICLYDVCSYDEPQSLACGCRFHSDCMASWKTRETHCPTCRAEICGESPIPRPESRLEINPTSPSPQHSGSLSGREMCYEGEAMPATKSRFRRLLSRLGLVCN